MAFLTRKGHRNTVTFGGGIEAAQVAKVAVLHDDVQLPCGGHAMGTKTQVSFGETLKVGYFWSDTENQVSFGETLK